MIPQRKLNAFFGPCQRGIGSRSVARSLASAAAKFARDGGAGPAGEIDTGIRGARDAAQSAGQPGRIVRASNREPYHETRRARPTRDIYPPARPGDNRI